MNNVVFPESAVFPEGRVYATQEQLTVCKDFALQSDVSMYTRRSRITDGKARDDVFRGKLAEWHVHDWLTNKGIPCSTPDMAIYGKRKKSWLPDLHVNVSGISTPLHVKAQDYTAAEKYGSSWVFQDTDKEIFGARPGLVAFVTTYNTSSLVHGVYDVLKLRENDLFKLTKLKIPGKLAVYRKDLEDVQTIKLAA